MFDYRMIKSLPLRNCGDRRYLHFMKISSYSNRIGGFASLNSGVIRNCYSDAKVSHERNAAGFVYENAGSIETSVAQKRTKGKENIGCFYVQNRGKITGSGWYCHTKKKKKKENYIDSDMIVDYDDITKIHGILGLGGVWLPPRGGDRRLELDSSAASYETRGKTPTVITSASQLLRIAADIASGNAEAADGYYKLGADIRIGMKDWVPIGLTESTPFTGIFDGAGYCVKGFKVRAKGIAAAGFFGYIRGGTVVNLSLDCIVDAAGGSLVGGLCASCDGGTVTNCRVVATVYASGVCGGFVGKNNGVIERCSFIGKVVKAIPIIIFFLPLIGALVALLVVGLILLLGRFGKTPYTPEVIDPNQAPVVDTGKYDPPPKGSERISVEMNQEAYFNVDTQVGLIDFVNPKRGTRDLLIHIVISDAELLRTVGTTGRTAEEQAALEAKSDYDPATSYQELYRSGLIQIGYALPGAKLGSLPNGMTLPEGDYSVLVVVDAYDPETYEKAVLKAQFPLMIHMVKSAGS